MSWSTEFELIREAIKEIREIRQNYEEWTSENEDICGYDDAKWFDTIAEFDAALGDAGLKLADLVEAVLPDPPWFRHSDEKANL